MWDKTKAWFKRSETIFLARLQVLSGVLLGVVTYALRDPNFNDAVRAVVDPDYLPLYLVGFGVLTEVLRRRRATDLR